jgi:hypothetical protein
MRKLSVIIVLCFALGWVGDCAAQPFAGQTRNKLVVKQSKRAIKRAAKGKNYYAVKKNGKVKRNRWGR